MFRRGEIRYRRLWVRMVCCLAVAIGVGNAVHFGVLEEWELLAREMFFGESDKAGPLAALPEMLVVLVACLGSAVPRIERPMAMVGCGTIYLVGYLLLLPAVKMITGFGLPIVSPFLGLMGSIGFLETMAWSEERYRRRDLEQLELAKQQSTDMLVHDLRHSCASLLIQQGVHAKAIGEPLGHSLRRGSSRCSRGDGPSWLGRL